MCIAAVNFCDIYQQQGKERQNTETTKLETW